MESRKKVFCLGHITVDIFMDRLTLNNLRLGGCIDSHNLTIHSGGDVANVSFWLGKLKTPVSMIGIIGDDPAGNFVKNELENMNVECRLKISKQFQTATILIIVEPDGERSQIANRRIQDNIEWKDIPIDDILECDLFYTSGYTILNPPIKDVIYNLFKSIKGNRSTSTVTMFNLAAYNTVERFKTEIKAKILPYVDILVGNKDEFQALVRDMKDEKKYTIHKIGRILQKELPNIEVILITDGGNGCYYFSQKKDGHIPTEQILAIDTTGAGDGFCAGFISGYLSGNGLEEAIRHGSRLGSHICKGYGARFGASEFSIENR
ncbi:MAG: carbohydrate kinase family protein [Candidatus Hodarchaeota archaeon]